MNGQQQFREENALQYLRQRFSLPWYFKRADVAIYFEYPRSLSTPEIFRRLGLEYNSTFTGEFSEATPVFIKEVNGDIIERIPSIEKFCKEVLLCTTDANIARKFVEKQYVIKYNNMLVTASFSEHFPGFHQGFEVNPYNLLRIRQEMRERGLYNGEILTLKEICEWYFENPRTKGIISRLCTILDIPYVNNRVGGSRQRQACSFRNLLSNEVSDFTSFNHAGRTLGLNHNCIAHYHREGRRFHAGSVPYQAV